MSLTNITPIMEEWKSVVGFKDYEVSNTIQVKSLSRWVVRGNYGYTIKEKILKPTLGKNGYYCFGLYENGKQYTVNLHRIVAEAWIPNPNNLPETNHKNGIKTDCSITNLEWASYSDNLNHALQTGLNSNKGETHYNVKLTDAQIQEIRTLKGTMTQRKIGEMFGVCQQHVCNIINNCRR